MIRNEVLIVGAGPTGLVLALWLTKLGVRVRIIDKAAEPGTTSRALAVQARTLELYRQLNLADTVVENGHQVPAVNLWAEGERKARLDFTHIGGDLTPYSFMEIFPQDEHERLLVERLRVAGVTVERQTELLSFREEGDHVVARICRPSAPEEECEASFIAGCDGARSLVRQTLDVGFPGGTYQRVFYVADVEASGRAIDGELHVDIDEADFVAIFPLAGAGRARFVGTVREDRTAPAEALKFEDVSSRAINSLRVQVEKVNWFSTYHVHHRVAEHFRKGRAFLLGDAAHVHSPVGGQGMNTGIGDAINLAWKFASVLQGRAPHALLDSYEPERIEFARKLVATTDRAFTLVTSDGGVAKLVRTRIAPVVISKLVKFEYARDFLFRTASQIALNYRASPLSQGKAGEVHGGDRLPWIKGLDNFRPLSEPIWQLHVYGSARPELSAWCRGNGLPLHVFPWSEAVQATGLAQDALYLVRPDTYVALADSSGDPNAIDSYFVVRGLQRPTV